MQSKSFYFLSYLHHYPFADLPTIDSIAIGISIAINIITFVDLTLLHREVTVVSKVDVDKKASMKVCIRKWMFAQLCMYDVIVGGCQQESKWQLGSNLTYLNDAALDAFVLFLFLL
jgi:hypothetical protein